MAEPVGVPRSDLARSARSRPVASLGGRGSAVEELPNWSEIGDAVWLAAVTLPAIDPALPYQPRDGGHTPEPDHRTEIGDAPEQQDRRPEHNTDARRVDRDDAAEAAAAYLRTESQQAREPATMSLDDSGTVGVAGHQGPPIRVPAPVVPDFSAIVRALRPLHRKVRSPRAHDVVLDEEATAERLAHGGLWFPSTKPAVERWLDLTLVLDASPSMALWRVPLLAFETVLERLGTFRTIQRRTLGARRTGPNGQVTPVLHGAKPTAATSGPAELLDHSGRRVLLVVTDGVSRNWRDPSFSAVLARWGAAMPTAVVHLLPQRMWRKDGLSLHRVRLAPNGRLTPNSRWSLELPDAWLEPEPEMLAPSGTVPVPIMELSARWFRRWAELLMGNRNDPIDATALLTHESPPPDQYQPEDETGSGISPRDQVKNFLGAASPPAFRLATLLAAVPVTLPVAQLIQTQLVPEGGAEHIAELLSSGIFQLEGEAAGRHPWDKITFVAQPRIREELLSGARRSETARVVRMVTTYLGDRIGTFGHVHQALDAPDSTPDPVLNPDNHNNVTIERIVMRALSGPYLSRAGRLSRQEEEQATLAQQAKNRPARTQVSESNDMSEAAERAGVATKPNPETGQGVDPSAVHTVHTPPPGEPDTGAPPAFPRAGLTSLAPVLGFDRESADVPPVWGNIPPRNPNFTGRVELLDKLGERLAAGGTTAVLPSALHGMGGIGKTQTAVEYIYRHLADYDVVWWIDASRSTQIRAGLTELAQALQLPGSSEANTAIPAVREALRRGQPFGRWLLVFDAAASPDIVLPFFPTPGGQGEILITSRNPDWAAVARPLEVATFMRQESIDLLRRRGPDIDNSEADQLASVLGDLPLAIEQAAAWRAETGMPVQEYLRLFDEKVAEILDTSTPADYEVSVAAAWNVSFDELRERSPAAHQLLQICAFFSPEPISRHLFAGGHKVSIAPELDIALRDPIRLSRAIRDINRYGLAKIDHRNNTLQLHRLVQLVLRNRMTPQRQAEMRHGAHQLLTNLDPNDPLSPKQWQRYQDILPHAYAADLISCEDSWGRQLVINLMSFLYRWGDHDEAVRLAENALAAWRETLGRNDPQSLSVASRLGYYYWIVGRYSEGAQLDRETLEIRRQVDGENSEETLSAQLAVSGDLRAAGEFAKAVEVSAEVYQKSKALFGDEDPTALRAGRAHCISLRAMGRYWEAAALDSATYQHQVEVLGNDHPETLGTLSGLILDRREAGEYLWARQEQEKLALRAQEIHGENNADTLRRFAYLAVARRKAGDHEGALELSSTVLERFRVRYGLDTLNAMACALGRSIDLRHAGELRSSRKQAEEVLKRYQDNIGPLHPYTTCATVDLAVTIRQLGDVETARDLDTQSLQHLRDSLGPDHVHSIVCAINLASDLAALGDTEAALEMDTDALERSERVLGANHPTTLAASLNLVHDLRALGREQDAEKRYTDVITRYRKVLGEQHPATIAAAKGVRADCDIDPLPL